MPLYLSIEQSKFFLFFNTLIFIHYIYYIENCTLNSLYLLKIIYYCYYKYKLLISDKL